MIASKYRISILGKRLKVGDARIITITCDGPYWPHGNHYYAIDDLIDQQTYHVPVDERPRWAKYEMTGH